MGFPTNLLASDEEVVLHLHPHWKALIWPVFVLLVVAAGGSFLAAVSPWPVVQLGIAAFAVVVLLIFTVGPILRWVTTHYVFTTHRVLLRSGVVSRTGRDIPLARINDVSFEHNLIERMLGLGTLTVESAGERGQVVLRDIPRVEQVQSTLYQLVDDEAERRGATGIEDH